MVDSNDNYSVNNASDERGNPPKEFLLADLAGAEQADHIFDSLVERNGEVRQTAEALRATRLSNQVSNAEITGGDLEDDLYQAEVVGEEAVGGQNPTPDQNITENLQKAMGISAMDGEPVRTHSRLEQRDNHRWELDPASAEDYSDRV